MNMWYKSGSELLREIEETVPAPGSIALWYIGQCGYIVKSPEFLVFIDPVLNDICEDGSTRRHYPAPFAPDALKPDFVICTHGHADHMAQDTVTAIARAFPETMFIIPAGCSKTAVQWGIDPSRIVGMSPRCLFPMTPEQLVSSFSAAHPVHVYDDTDPGMALSYCVELEGIRLFHLGDTYLTEDLLRSLMEEEPPHILIAPVNGDDRFRAMRSCIGNMEAEEAAKLAVRLGADLSIPCHYDMIFDNTVDPLRFAAELRRLNPAAKWKIPALGEQILYTAQPADAEKEY